MSLSPFLQNTRPQLSMLAAPENVFFFLKRIKISQLNHSGPPGLDSLVEPQH